MLRHSSSVPYVRRASVTYRRKSLRMSSPAVFLSLCDCTTCTTQRVMEARMYGFVAIAEVWHPSQVMRIIYCPTRSGMHGTRCIQSMYFSPKRTASAAMPTVTRLGPLMRWLRPITEA